MPENNPADAYNDNPLPMPLTGEAQPKSLREPSSAVFIMKIVLWFFLPTLIYIGICKLLSFWLGYTFMKVWGEGILWAPAGLAPIVYYFILPRSAVASMKKLMKSAIILLLSLVLSGYLYGTGKLIFLFS